MRPSKKARKIGAFSCAGIFILLLGMVAGFFISKYVGTELLTSCYDGRQPQDASRSSVQLPAGYQRGAALPINVQNLRQLPAPGTPEALDFESRGDLAQPLMLLYQLISDSDVISEQLTEAFLEQLREQLQSNNDPNAAPGSFSAISATLIAPGTNMTQVITTIKGVARDVLSYFRYHRSAALLPLLRQFSLRGSLAVTDVDPDVLRAEIGELLNLGTMNKWYADVSRYDSGAITTQPPPPDANAGSSSQAQPTAQSLVAAQSSGRRLLYPHHQPQYQQQAMRHLQQATGARIPAISDDSAAAQTTIPTVGPLLSLRDMLCLIEPFSPVGLKGISLPAPSNDSTNAVQGPITCDLKPPTQRYKEGQFVFKPVVIPVVFHCQRFLDGDVLQPPIWDAESSGQNLIQVANKFYKDTGVQFKLQEVRSDVEKYPYLLLGSLADWQSCSGNPSQEAAGFPCLKDTARFPDVAALAEKLVINVIVGGSQTSAFCNFTETEVCTTMYLGYCSAMGPWFSRPSPTWREGLSEENWVFITWDMFAPSVKNAWRFWDGGGVTLAHELGHYLALMHTHEGATPCEGDGLTKADSVPDTPENLQTEQWAAQNGLAVQLAKWCAQFRNSKAPNPKDLLVFNSCKRDDTVDNIFNLLSYLPDACCMILTPNQIARLQWATTRFRPKMMAQFAA